MIADEEKQIASKISLHVPLLTAYASASLEITPRIWCNDLWYAIFPAFSQANARKQAYMVSVARYTLTITYSHDV